MSEWPDELLRRWVHVREEDEGDVRVYRPADADIPPARGRRGIEFRPGGELLVYGPGPADSRPLRRAAGGRRDRVGRSRPAEAALAPGDGGLTVPPQAGSPPRGRGSARIGAPGPRDVTLSPMTAALDALTKLRRLEAERLDAVEAGLGGNELYMTDLRTTSRPRAPSTSASP